jgi:hypothetical protein
MAEAAGKQVADSWHTLELEEKVAIMKDLVSIEKKLLSISFTRYAVAASFLGSNRGPLIALQVWQSILENFCKV